MFRSLFKLFKRRSVAAVNTEPRVYFTEQDIVKDLLAGATATDIRNWRAYRTKEELTVLHFSLGMYIRNHYYLWDADNPYTFAEAPPNADGVIDHVMFPDQVSQRIIELAWHRVMEEHGPLPPGEIEAVRKEIGIEHRPY